MWLLDTSTLELKELTGGIIPDYAILSHTWGLPEDEVSFRDLRKDRASAGEKLGYRKVEKFCSKAAEDGYQFGWIDTCCIDKRSSAELSEAINSMFKWYQNAQVCYVYLVDVPSSDFDPSPALSLDDFSSSRWFRRGWTLQELIAPRRIQFFASDWVLLGTKGSDTESNMRSEDPFLLKLAKITGIKEEVLQNPSEIYRAPIAQKMSWAAQRQTTREEDCAYALMGLFNVNMPILYGEGERNAFKRLQLEILKSAPDQSIFAWRSDRQSSGLLAEKPSDFARSGKFQPWNSRMRNKVTILPYSMTNMGISINLPILSDPYLLGPGVELAVLQCWTDVDGQYKRLWIYLKCIERASTSPTGRKMYRREQCDTLRYFVDEPGTAVERRNIYVLEDEQLAHVELVDGINPYVNKTEKQQNN